MVPYHQPPLYPEALRHIKVEIDPPCTNTNCCYSFQGDYTPKERREIRRVISEDEMDQLAYVIKTTSNICISKFAFKFTFRTCHQPPAYYHLYRVLIENLRQVQELELVDSSLTTCCCEILLNMCNLRNKMIMGRVVQARIYNRHSKKDSNNTDNEEGLEYLKSRLLYAAVMPENTGRLRIKGTLPTRCLTIVQSRAYRVGVNARDVEKIGRQHFKSNVTVDCLMRP